jgi:hypothetical protein
MLCNHVACAWCHESGFKIIHEKPIRCFATNMCHEIIKPTKCRMRILATHGNVLTALTWLCGKRCTQSSKQRPSCCVGSQMFLCTPVPPSWLPCDCTMPPTFMMLGNHAVPPAWLLPVKYVTYICGTPCIQPMMAF